MESDIFEEMTMIDSRCENFRITLEELKRVVDEIKYSKNLPKEIKEELDICKKLFMYSYFAYEFARVAEQKTYLIIEGALKEKLRLYYPDGFEFKNRETKKVELHKPHSLASFQNLLNRDELMFREKDGYFKRGISLKYLFDWLVGKNLYKEEFSEEVDTLRKLRNHSAHPIGATILPVWNSMHHFRRLIDFLNKVYT